VHRLSTWIAPVLSLILALSAGAVTRNNDDSCDIAVLPAATLLLPYFEVDLDDPSGETTIFTIANVAHEDAIARVTLWTDRAYPVLTFNVYLTGYDVQAISLYDVLSRGIIAPDAGTGTEITDRGDFSDHNSRLDLTGCERLAGALDDAAVIRMQSAFLEGTIPGGCSNIGGGHDNAIGYATIDVVGNCSSQTPADAAYWNTDLRYDNVLLGDYQQIQSRNNSAQGGPLVHIRAIPEGGRPAERRVSSEAGFPRTFYARHQSRLTPKLDARQPLPSQFAVRWIQGSDSEFATSLKIWREARAGIDAGCADYAAELSVHELVTFDEDENAVGSGGARNQLGATSRTSVDDAEAFPQLANGAHSGWTYLNLDRSARDDFASQAWVISSMGASTLYSVDFDAIALGNGCSAPPTRSEVSAMGGAPIAPAPNESNLDGIASTDNDDSCDVGLLPAATLLLPYFEVDVDDPRGETTIFTITNVSPSDQIARVTLWTDYSFPVVSFNIYLTGYDVQSINLFDVIERGIIAPESGTGTHLTGRGRYSDRNGAIDRTECARLPGQLSEAYIVRMQSAFTEGTVPDLGDLQGCNNVGNEHDNAVGYATIDLVRNCSANGPFSEEYWTEDLAYDNVLIGDHQQVHPRNNFAQGSPLVHIRAIPEGGTLEERRALPRKYDARFPRTFYSRYQSASTPNLDGRQPLPSTFVARWINGGASGFQTFFKIWREGKTGRTATCAIHDDNVVKVMEIVAFDEQENAWGDIPESRVCTPITTEFTLPATSLTSVDDSPYPQPDNGAIAGWVYLNLDHCEHKAWASNNWVVSSIRAEGRYSVDMDAAALGNGCSPDTPMSEVTTGTWVIGPLGNTNQ
jgi:hypothetical protein